MRRTTLGRPRSSPLPARPAQSPSRRRWPAAEPISAWRTTMWPKPEDCSSSARVATRRRGWTISCARSEEHTSELQSRFDLVCRLLLEKKNHELLLFGGLIAMIISIIHDIGHTRTEADLGLTE